MGQELRGPKNVWKVSELSHFDVFPSKTKYVSSSQQALLGKVSPLVKRPCSACCAPARVQCDLCEIFQVFSYFRTEKKKKSPRKSQSTERSFPGSTSAGKTAARRQPKPGCWENGFCLLARALLPVPQSPARAGSPPSPGIAGVKGEHQLLSCVLCPHLQFPAIWGCPSLPRSAPAVPARAWVLGGPGGAGEMDEVEATRPHSCWPEQAADLTPGVEAGSRRSNSGAVLTSAKTQGIKGTLMGSKLSCAPWRIPGCLCSCQINSPVTAVMFNIPSHYLAGIPGLLQGLQPGPSHIFSPSPHPASWAAAALKSIFEMQPDPGLRRRGYELSSALVPPWGESHRASPAARRASVPCPHRPDLSRCQWLARQTRCRPQSLPCLSFPICSTALVNLAILF